jgi:DNA-binding transcriptional regulator YiaG
MSKNEQPTVTADEIRQLRRDLCLTQLGLARTMGLSREAIANWEGGNGCSHGPSVIILGQLRVQADIILARTDTPIDRKS